MSQYFALQFGTGDPRNFGSMAPTFLSFVNMTTGATLAPPAIAEALPGLGIYQFQYSVSLPIAFLADAATTSPGTAGRYIAGQIDPSDRIDHFGTSILAFGVSSIALGTSAIAIGNSNIALGTSNLAIGVSNLALGTSLLAIGNSNLAQGTSILAIGVSNLATGQTLLGFGVSGFAQGSTLFGIGTTLIGYGTSIYASSISLMALGLTLGTLDARIGFTSSTFGDSSTDPGTIYGYLKRIQEFQEGQASFTKLTGSWAVKSRGGSLLASKTVVNSSSTVTKV